MKPSRICLALLLVLAATHAGYAQAARQPQDQPPREPKSEPARSPLAARGAQSLVTDPAQWVPADALFYLGITDIADTWEGLKKTSLYAMLTDPAVAQAFAAPAGDSRQAGLSLFGSALAELRARVARTLDLEPDQLENPLAGPLALYLAPGGPRVEDLQPGLIAGVGDGELMKKYYDTAVAKLKQIGEHEAVSVGSDSIDVFTIQRDKKGGQPLEPGQEEQDQLEEFEERAGPPFGVLASPSDWVKRGLDNLFSPESLPSHLALCLTADRLIVGGSADQVRRILRREESGRSLADAEDYQELLRHLRPTGTVRLLVNLPGMIQMVRAATDEADMEDLRKGLSFIGADSFRSLVGHIRLGAASYDWKIELLLLMARQRSGLAKLLSMANLPTAPPDTVPADTSFYFACNLDIPRLLEDIEGMVRGIEPTEADEFRDFMQVELPDGGKVDLRAEFFNHLHGPLIVSFGLSRPLGLNSAQVLATIGHRDQDAMLRFLSSPLLVGLLQPRDLRGTQVFDLAPLPMFGVPSGLSVAATTDRLVFGNAPAVERALAGRPPESLAQTEGWRRAGRLVPEQSWLTVYVDNRKLMEAVMELARNREQILEGGLPGQDLSTAILMKLLESASPATKDADPSRTEKLLHYSSQAVYTVSQTDAGVQFTAVQLRPEK